MAKIIMKGWKKGLEKVSLTKLKIELLNISLKESKSNVDALLNDEEVILEIESDLLAKSFFDKAKKIGVICSLEMT
jgi:hypothetical protein